MQQPADDDHSDVDDDESDQSYDGYADYVDQYGDEMYVTAAFRCCFGKQAYLFMGYEYLLLDYDPRTLDGRVVDGPKLISKGIPSLYGTVFADYGIYCAFGLHHRNEAFIFSGGDCARVAYARDSSDFKILEDTTVSRMFPYLKGTAFGSHVDVAFESSTTDNEAYLFSGIEYAVINYEDGCLISDKQTFDCLRDTIFQSGIDAAFASHVPGEAFIFKDDSYALINFIDQRIIGDVKKILPDGDVKKIPSASDGCPSLLSSVLPRKNYQLDQGFIYYSSDEDQG